MENYALVVAMTPPAEEVRVRTPVRRVVLRTFFDLGICAVRDIDVPLPLNF